MSGSVKMIPDHHWLGLCLLTESNRPEEWPYVAWVIRNRVESPRYPDTYEGVILQPMQFSRFNKLTAARIPPLTLLRSVGATFLTDQLLLAADVARDVIASADTYRLGVSHALHYYSPISMKPAGSAPAWAKKAKRLFTPTGIDPQRFVFAEGVP